MRLGELVERERKRRGLSLEGLARRVGLTKVAIYKFEIGKICLADDHIRQIAPVLDLSPVALLEMAAIDRGSLVIRDQPHTVQRLICRLAHGNSVSPETAAKLAAILDQEQPLAA